jgi:dipeptidyl aminopeptidase/acylaminoacyl peptidase
MIPMRSSIATLLFACLLCTGLADAAKQPIVETDLLKIAQVTEVKLTPDGAFAVYTVLSIHTDPPPKPTDDPAYSYRTNLWMVNLRDASSPPVQLTYGDRTDTSIEISPDGRQLAFLRPDEKKKPQVWLLNLHEAGEAHVATALEYGAANPRWRPDSQALLVSSPIPVSKLPGKPPFSQERPARDWTVQAATTAENPGDKKNPGSPDGDIQSIRAWLDHNSEHADPADLTRLAFLGELNLAGELTFAQLFRVDLATTPKTIQLTKTFLNHNAAVWSAQGDRVLFAAEADPSLQPDRGQGKSAIYTMTAGGENEHLLIHPAGFSAGQPRFTHAGRIVFVTRQDDQPTYRQSMLAEANPDGGGIQWLTKAGEPGIQHFEIAPDDSIYYSIDLHGGEPLFHIQATGSSPATVIAPPLGINAFAVSDDKLVYAQIAPENPNELYLASRAGLTSRSAATPRRLTDLNAPWLAEKLVSLPEERWITRPDGTRVQYWVMPPTGAAPATRYPWVLDMHGGPSAMWGPGEFTMWHEFQMFCSFGYGVVYGNPRGSSGYGYTFQRANYQDWGDGPMSDVMATLADAEMHYSSIDKDRLFVTGGSYAGYLTAWIVGHTKVFKAAAALRGVYDLSTFFGEGNAYRLVPEEFGGFPWQPETRRLLDRESPITYASNIVTPLLIIHGSSDNRTGVVQGQMLFRTLKELNRPVEYIRYPGSGHELTRSGPPQQRMDHMLRIIEFFERYSHNSRAAPVAGL